MFADDHKPYNKADKMAQQALDAFFGSPLVLRFMLERYGAKNNRKNPVDKAVDVVAQNDQGDQIGIELEVKKALGAWKGVFSQPDIQVADRKVRAFEQGDLFVMFDEPREWALVWDCSTLAVPWERRTVPGQGGFLIVPIRSAALIKVKAEVSGPDVVFDVGGYGRPDPDQKLVSTLGW